MPALPTAIRYTLIQLPEAGLVATLLYLAVHHDWLTVTTALLLAGLWVIKDAALYPLYRHALRDGPPVGAAALVGRQGRTVTALSPEGHVRLNGEHWRARLTSGDYLPSGVAVTVVHFEGLTLLVRAAAPE